MRSRVRYVIDIDKMAVGSAVCVEINEAEKGIDEEKGSSEPMSRDVLCLKTVFCL
jgi:hypothetical protein